jgi:hypothetical protein
VLEVEVAKDWLDYAQAFGVIGAVVLAIAALILAIRSASHSSRSAAAAERTANAAAEQAARSRLAAGEAELAIDRTGREIPRREGSRRPRFAIPGREGSRRPRFATPALVLASTLPSERLPIDDSVGMTAITFWPVVVRATFENVGDETAEQAVARFLVPETVGLMRSGPAGEDRTRVDLHRGDDVALKAGDERPSAHAYAWRVARLEPGQLEVLHATLAFHVPGEFEVELQIENEEAAPVSQRFAITHSETALPQVAPVA